MEKAISSMPLYGEAAADAVEFGEKPHPPTEAEEPIDRDRPRKQKSQ